MLRLRTVNMISQQLERWWWWQLLIFFAFSSSLRVRGDGPQPISFLLRNTQTIQRRLVEDENVKGTVVRGAAKNIVQHQKKLSLHSAPSIIIRTTIIFGPMAKMQLRESQRSWNAISCQKVHYQLSTVFSECLCALSKSLHCSPFDNAFMRFSSFVIWSMYIWYLSNDNWEKEKMTMNFSCIILAGSNSMKSLRERERPDVDYLSSQISELSPPICFDIYTNRYWMTIATQGNVLQCMQVSNENNKQ